jgi:hypothetical protein
VDPKPSAQDLALTKFPKQEVPKKSHCVVLANFSDLPLHIPNSTMIGLEEPISETLGNQVNPTVRSDKVPPEKGKNGNGALYRMLLKGKLDHQPKAHRMVLEHVLPKYAHIFHDEESNDFRSTNVVLHQIRLEDETPIRRPVTLREGISSQVEKMLKK